MAKVKPVIVLAKENWAGIEAGAHLCVVQVCAEIQEFNWDLPYTAGQQAESRGSGFFIDSDGHILTTAHTVENARLVWIKMPSLGSLTTLFADIIGICPDRDVALLKMRPEALAIVRNHLSGIPHLMLGNSDAVNHTDKILVLGYPFGHHQLKSSTGVISGRESGAGRTFFQITAPVNPGNSGGPLFNDQGLVIGMTIAMIMFAQNVGYAIPINDIAMVLDDLHKKKLVRSISLGARFNSCDDAQALFLANPVPAGLYVNTVFKNSLFEKIGVQEGDMLYQFNGFTIDAGGSTAAPWTIDRISIHDLVSRLTVGQKVPMVLFRKGKKIELEFTVQMMEPYPIRWIYPWHEAVEYEVIGGMVIMQLTDNHINEFIQELPYLCHYLQTEHKIKPVLVISHVIPGSYAYQNGSIRRGQIIFELNGKPVSMLQDVRQAIADSFNAGFLSVKTNDNVFVVFSFEKILANEQRLAHDFNYTMNSTIQSLLDLVNKK